MKFIAQKKLEACLEKSISGVSFDKRAQHELKIKKVSQYWIAIKWPWTSLHKISKLYFDSLDMLIYDLLSLHIILNFNQNIP